MVGAAALALGTPAPVAAAAQPIGERVAATLAAQGPGVRFGLLVATLDGQEIVAIRPDDRFVPASNTKMFTTAAAFATLTGLDQPDAVGGAAVRLERDDVVLEGHGDARLSSAPECTVDCLAVLADAVAAKTHSVGDVIADDTAFPDERWSPGMSWNNLETRSGTGVSALTLDDNELTLTVTPGAAGQPPSVASLGYFAIDNQAVTAPGAGGGLTADRLPGSRTLRLGGAIAPGAAPAVIKLGIDDPADYAAWRLRALLEGRGVRVRGDIRVRHRLSLPARAPLPPPLAKLVPPPLAEDLALTNKVSQNVHAELFLRRVGRVGGGGSIADGQAAVQAMLAVAGVPRWAYDFADGSGMSSYNRVTPRASVTFLRWTAAQPWGAAFRATLPVGGVDGTLRNRFKGTPLAGRVTAKTGTLNQANAIAGFLTGASGRTLVFAAYAADMPDDASATKPIDAALALIAAEN